MKNILYGKDGANEEEMETLKEAYQLAYDDAADTINTIEQCEETLINYHNTILNSGVRS